jgi:DNA polymerase/3'-5' exonuclease PolX
MSTTHPESRPSPESSLRGCDNASVAEALGRVAQLLEAEGKSPERARTWRRAARAIEASPRPVAQLVEERGVEGIHGLGLDYVVSGLIADLLRTGRLPLLERLEARSACGSVFQRVPGIGPKLARELRQVLGVESLDGLARAAHDGTLSAVCGFGPRRSRLVASMLAPMERRACSEGSAAQLDLWASE